MSWSNSAELYWSISFLFAIVRNSTFLLSPILVRKNLFVCKIYYRLDGWAMFASANVCFFATSLRLCNKASRQTLVCTMAINWKIASLYMWLFQLWRLEWIEKWVGRWSVLPMRKCAKRTKKWRKEKQTECVDEPFLWLDAWRKKKKEVIRVGR